VNGTDHKYGFGGKEEQDELGLGWIGFKWRNHDPALGRFMNIDPLTEDYMDWGPYVFSGNIVINAREVEGLEPAYVAGTGQDTGGTNRYANPISVYVNKKVGSGDLSKPEANFVMKNKIKSYKARKNDGIAARFASNSGIPTDPLNPNKNDSRDAIRHSLWSALNTQTSGEEFARGIGQAHEEGNNFGATEMTMDLFNNEIGIALGLENPDASPFELISLLIDTLSNGGLVVINPNTGKIEQSKLPKEDVQNTKDTANSLYSDGDTDAYDDDN